MKIFPAIVALVVALTSTALPAAPPLPTLVAYLSPDAAIALRVTNPGRTPISLPTFDGDLILHARIVNSPPPSSDRRNGVAAARLAAYDDFYLKARAEVRKTELDAKLYGNWAPGAPVIIPARDAKTFVVFTRELYQVRKTGSRPSKMRTLESVLGKRKDLIVELRLRWNGAKGAGGGELLAETSASEVSPAHGLPFEVSPAPRKKNPGTGAQ